MAVMYPMGGMLPHYIKKEDARELVDSQRKVFALVVGALGIVMGIMQLFVLPRIQSIYTELNVPIPVFTRLSPIISTIVVASTIFYAGYLLATKPDYSHVDKVASTYKKGEMIKSREILSNSKGYLVMLVVLGITFFMILSVVLPIRNLINSVS